MKTAFFALSSLSLALVSQLASAQVQALWRNTDGSNYLLVHDTSDQLKDSYALKYVPNDWQISGQGDLDGDGMTDLVWRNQHSGQVYVWLMTGGQIRAEGSLVDSTGADWNIAAVADFTSDGKADLIWRNSQTGQHVLWALNGSQLTQEFPLPEVKDLNWQPVGAGDFNGDGTADLLWRHQQTGDNYLFLFQNGSIVKDGSIFTAADLNWQPKLGDFNRDGRTDILWRHAQTGQNYVTLMNGFQVQAEASLPTVADLQWQLAGIADFDQNGTSDLVWRHGQTGQNALFLLDANGLQLKGDALLTTVADTNWQIGALLNNGLLNPQIEELFAIGSSQLLTPLLSNLLLTQGYSQLQWALLQADGATSHSGVLYCGLNPLQDTQKGLVNYQLTVQNDQSNITLNYQQCQNAGQSQKLNGNLNLTATQTDSNEDLPGLSLNGQLSSLEIQSLSSDDDFSVAVLSGETNLDQQAILDSESEVIGSHLTIVADLDGTLDTQPIEINGYQADFESIFDQGSTSTLSAEVIRAGISYQLATPVTFSWDEQELTEGKLTIDSSNGQKLSVEVEDGSLVFSLDLNGDGTADITETYAINQL